MAMLTSTGSSPAWSIALRSSARQGDEELAGLPVALVPGVGHPGGGKVHHRQGCGLPHRPGTQQGQPPRARRMLSIRASYLATTWSALPAHRVEVALQLPGKGGQVPLLHQGGDALVGQVQGLEAGEQQDLLNLALVVVAVSVPVVPMGGFQQALLVVVPQLLGGDVAEVGHLPPRCIWSPSSPSPLPAPADLGGWSSVHGLFLYCIPIPEKSPSCFLWRTKVSHGRKVFRGHSRGAGMGGPKSQGFLRFYPRFSRHSDRYPVIFFLLPALAPSGNIP